jgi:hypothetical protein
MSNPLFSLTPALSRWERWEREKPRRICLAPLRFSQLFRCRPTYGLVCNLSLSPYFCVHSVTWYMLAAGSPVRANEPSFFSLSQVSVTELSDGA